MMRREGDEGVEMVGKEARRQRGQEECGRT